MNRHVIAVVTVVALFASPLRAAPPSPSVVVEGAVETLSADRTATVVQEYVSLDSLAPHEIGPIDIAPYGTIRVSVDLDRCGPCGPVLTQVFTTSEESPTPTANRIDSFVIDVSETEEVSRTYEVPGERLLLTLEQESFDGSTGLNVVVFGRAN